MYFVRLWPILFKCRSLLPKVLLYSPSSTYFMIFAEVRSIGILFILSRISSKLSSSSESDGSGTARQFLRKRCRVRRSSENWRDMDLLLRSISSFSLRDLYSSYSS